jgi:hypothetical protein
MRTSIPWVSGAPPPETLLGCLQCQDLRNYALISAHPSSTNQVFSTFFLCSKISSMMPYSLACCAPM